MIQSYELSVCCLFVPTVIAIFKKEGCFLAALLSILFGAGAFLLFRVVPIAFPKEILSIVFSLFGFYCGDFITKRREVLEKA
jgi:SSS family solute:Na+ symporter